MKILASIATALFCATAAPAVQAEPYTIFLLDVSGSMDYPVASGKRIDRAKEALLDVFASGQYPDAELIMWNSGKIREGYGSGAQLASQVRSAPRGHQGSLLGSAFQSISDNGYQCAHIVFVTDEYPDDWVDYQDALNNLLLRGGQNTVTVFVVEHAEARYYAGRFSTAVASSRYRVVDGSQQDSLAAYLAANPPLDACGALS
ncbi:VWA domain-containing protein [Tropicimonas marinistellae]|uniref:VWA domain-containing protein n=1 Tax=Tropicimonas marinistellae TaxID=1739787 RepID=UPI000830CA09|nr:VWA domain-containing protein [Tropicimonas marinistellae]